MPLECQNSLRPNFFLARATVYDRFRFHSCHKCPSENLNGTEDETTSKQGLRELVGQYRKENATLKPQLNKFTPITIVLERLQAENTKLSSQVHALRVEKDDVLQRFEIGLREVCDLNDRLSEQKRETAQQLRPGSPA
jgi:hypothetical protein